MTREIALHCMKSYSELHSDLCELCPIYGQTGSDHCFEDALEYVIKDLEQEPVIDKIRAEIAEFGSIWVEYKISGRSDKDIEQLVSDVLKQAKEQVLDVIDKYKAETEGRRWE